MTVSFERETDEERERDIIIIEIFLRCIIRRVQIASIFDRSGFLEPLLPLELVMMAGRHQK